MVCRSLTQPSLRAARRRAASDVPPTWIADRRGRRRQHLERRHVEVLAVVLDDLARPELAHHLEHLVGALAPLGEGDAHGVELLLHPPHADAELDAVARQHRRGADLLGDVHRRAGREDVHGGEEPQPLGHAGEVGDRDPRVGPLGAHLPPPPAVGRVGVGRPRLHRVDEVVGDRSWCPSPSRRRPGRAAPSSLAGENAAEKQNSHEWVPPSMRRSAPLTWMASSEPR